jgi:hypothetical protein
MRPGVAGLARQAHLGIAAVDNSARVAGGDAVHDA